MMVSFVVFCLCFHCVRSEYTVEKYCRKYEEYKCGASAVAAFENVTTAVW